MRPRGWASASPRCLPAARLRTLFGEPLFIPSPHGRGVLPTPRAEALRPQVESVLRGIRAMFAPPRLRRKPAAGHLLSRCMKTRR